MSSQKAENRSFLILLGLLFIAGVWILYPFIKTIILAAVFTILFYPLHKKYLRWTNNRETLSSVLSVLSVLIFLIIPLAIVFTLVTDQLTGLIQASENEQLSLSEYVVRFREKIISWSTRFESLAGFHFDLSGFLHTKMRRLAETMARYSPTVVTETLNWLLHVFILIITSFYLFREGKDFFQLGQRLSPIKDQYEKKLATEIKTTIQGVFYGSFLTALVQAVLATLGYYIAGLDAFLVWGLLTFFMAFLPLLGTGVVVAPLVLLLFAQGHTKQAIFLLSYGTLIVASADNLLRPLLIRSNIHPFLLFLSVFGGLEVFGMIGLLLGPTLMGMLTAVLKIYAKDFR